MAEPLTAKQQQAADLLGLGWRRKPISAELGISPRTINRWMQRSDFMALVNRRRQIALADNPTAKTTLEAALTATTATGKPDWKTRVSAARALIGADKGDDPDPTPPEAEFFD